MSAGMEILFASEQYLAVKFSPWIEHRPGVCRGFVLMVRSLELADEEAFTSVINQKVQNYGAVTAAHLTGIRHLALTALSAQHTEELIVEMGTFASLANMMDADMVAAALSEPAGFCPEAVQPLFTEFCEILPAQGSLTSVLQLQNS